MANLVFYMDYGPLLSRIGKSAFLMYIYYEKFQNDEGIVQITYSELDEHLGLATETVRKSIVILKQLHLIEEVPGTQGKKYRMPPVKKLTSELKAQLLAAYKAEQYNDQTILRKKYLDDNIPEEFKPMLLKKNLKQALKEIGSLRRAKELCKFFNVDHNTFKLLNERDGTFKQKFIELAKELEQVTEKPTKKKTNPNLGESERAVASYLYDQLAERDLKPIDKKWFFRNCATAHDLLKELTQEEIKQVIDYGLSDPWWSDKMNNLTVISKLYPKYKLQNKKPKLTLVSRATPIPSTIKEEISRVSKIMQIDTYEDAYMLKQSVLNGQNNGDILLIVDILEKNNIIPTGDANIKFG